TASGLMYYRVAAVDIAGNIGDLSPEISVYASVKAEAKVQENPPTKETRDWAARTGKDIDTLLIDLEWAITNLNDIATKESAVDLLGLKKTAMSAKTDIEKVKAQVKAVDFDKSTDTDLRDFLSKTDALLARSRKGTPQGLEILKTTSFVQSLTEEDIDAAAKEFLRTANYSEKQYKYYLKQMVGKNLHFKAEADVKTLKISYLDGEETKVLVTKRIWYDSSEKLGAGFLVEMIPKSLAGDISAVDIRTPDYMVINEDPVISWTVPDLGYEKVSFTYALLAEDLSEAAKQTRSVVMLDPIGIIKDEKSMITGFSFNFVKGTGMQIIGILVGILIIIGLGSYYIVVVQDIDIAKYLPKASLPNIGMLQRTPKLGKDDPLDAKPESYFSASNGDVIRCLSELDSALERMDDFSFHFHVNSEKNDFAEWANSVYQDKSVSDGLRKTITREEMIKLIRKMKGNRK
ncbi:MAG: hypothetical protein HGA85_03545, partial [Nanoarchaeota archaeon]|nr:hypothetical protein [Nanoarchaeota archaeon]